MDIIHWISLNSLKFEMKVKGRENQLTPITALRSAIVTVLALSTAAATCV